MFQNSSKIRNRNNLNLSNLITFSKKYRINSLLFVTFLFFLFFNSTVVKGSSVTAAQLIDSLKNQFKNSEEDTNKINTLIELGILYQNRYVDTAVYFHTMAFELLNTLLDVKKHGTKYFDKTTQFELRIRKSELLKLLGWDNYLQHNYYKALVLYDEVIHRMDSELGDLQRSDNNMNDKSKRLRVQKLKVSCIGNKGVVYWSKGDYSKALEYCFGALKISEEIGDSVKQAANLGNLGAIYFKLNDFDKALDYFLLAIDIQEKLDNSRDLVNNINNIGILYKNRGDYSKALAYYNKSLKLYEEADNFRGICAVLENIGSLYKAQGDMSITSGNTSYAFADRYPRALEYNNKALNIRKLYNDNAGQIYCFRNIGTLYTILGKYESAEANLTQAYTIAMKFNLLTEVFSIHQNLSDLYKKEGKSSLALLHYKKYVQYRDSIFNQENKRENLQREIQFNYNKKFVADSIAFAKEKEVGLVRMEREKTQKYSLYGGLLIAMAFSGLILNRFKKTQKQKNIIEHQKSEVESKNKQITDSIKYALGIQQAILVSEETIQKYLPHSFIYYSPKDIVSGDFYWFSQVKTVSVFAVIDCTGHGVPGGFLTMLGNSLLNEIVNEEKIVIPALILNTLSKKLYKTFRTKQINGFSSDGMDISICAYDSSTKILQFAGAKNSLYLVQDNNLSTIKGDIWSIGSYFSVKDNFDFKFKNNSILIDKPTSAFLTTDGLIDQFGGENKERFGKRRFKELLQKSNTLNSEEQKQFVINTISEWANGRKQLDDQLIMGVNFM